MGGVSALEPVTQSPALNCFGQNHSGGTRSFYSCGIGGVELLIIVAASRQVLKFRIGEMFDHGAQPRVRAEKVLPDKASRFNRVLLELTIDR